MDYEYIIYAGSIYGLMAICVYSFTYWIEVILGKFTFIYKSPFYFVKHITKHFTKNFK